MNPTLRNILSVVAGWLIGSVVNMGLVNLGHVIFPIDGVDMSDMEALAAAIPSLSAEYFLFPFLGHALGTLVGAFIAAKLAVSHKRNCALAVGIIFLLGGILVNYMFTGPMWFTIVDIAFAYIPMAWLGAKLAMK